MPVRISHILFPNDAEANFALRTMKAENISFEAYARIRSRCNETKDRDGDLGYITEDQFPLPNRAIATTAFSLNVGEVSKPVETKAGWHLIKRTE